jgi:hypothetical protein
MLTQLGFIHKLSNIGPSSGWCAGEYRFTVAPQSEIGQWGFSVYKTRPSFLHCCALFLFDQLFRVFDGSIVMVLATLLTYLQFSVIKWAKQCPGQSPIDVPKAFAVVHCCVQNVGGAFGRCYVSIRALEVSSFALTMEFVLCVCVCSFCCCIGYGV